MPPPAAIRPFCTRSFFALAAALGAGRAAAQSEGGQAPETAPAALAPDKPSGVAKSAGAGQPAKADERQITDSDIATALIDGMPRFDPAKPNGNTIPDEKADSDKPKNGIVRLPKYVVTEKRPPVFTERNSYSKSGLEQIAIKRYLNDFDSKVLNRWYIPFLTASNGQRAMQMYNEQERLDNLAGLNDEARAISAGGDPSEGEYIKKAAQETYMRDIDWGWGAKGSLGLGADLGN